MRFCYDGGSRTCKYNFKRNNSKIAHHLYTQRRPAWHIGQGGQQLAPHELFTPFVQIDVVHGVLPRIVRGNGFAEVRVAPNRGRELLFRY